MKTYTFNSKETYLAYRSNWKAEYKQLSQAIRDERIQIRSQRGIESSQYWYLKGLKEKATNMITELHEAKEEAQRQYLAAKKELVTA